VCTRLVTDTVTSGNRCVYANGNMCVRVKVPSSSRDQSCLRQRLVGLILLQPTARPWQVHLPICLPSSYVLSDVAPDMSKRKTRKGRDPLLTPRARALRHVPPAGRGPPACGSSWPGPGLPSAIQALTPAPSRAPLPPALELAAATALALVQQLPPPDRLSLRPTPAMFGERPPARCLSTGKVALPPPGVALPPPSAADRSRAHGAHGCAQACPVKRHCRRARARDASRSGVADLHSLQVALRQNSEHKCRISCTA